MLSEVTGDLFRIATRLKRINRGYKVYWNACDQRFEVHTKGLEFIVPYNELDCRTLEYALRTRRENADDIVAETNAHNVNINNSARKSVEHATSRLADMLDFAKSTGHPVTFTKNNLKEF